MKEVKKVAVVGAGAWGTALAQAMARAGKSVTLWAREQALADKMRLSRENDLYLPSVRLDDRIHPTANYADLADHDVILMVTPAQFLRSVGAEIAPYVAKGTPILIASKGIELESLELLSTVAEEVFPEAEIGIISGPTFAIEVALAKPAAITLALPDQELANHLARELSSKSFRIYSTNDVVGAQIGGAIKNVLAIACGIIHGRGLGENARAAILTRGLYEISKLSEKMGGRPETLMGLSGLGDLTLTCSSQQSRNMSLGTRLGQGETLEEILGSRRSVSEGVYTAKAATDLAEKTGTNMPICAAVKAILHDGADLDRIITDLMSRPIRQEV